VDPRADRDVMEKRKPVAPAGGRGCDSKRGPSVSCDVCGVTYYFLGVISREYHDQKA